MKGKKLSEEEVDARLSKRKIRRLGLLVNMATKTECECLKCGYLWHTKPGSILYRSCGCPRCAGNARVSPEAIRALCAERGLKLSGGMVNVSSKAEFECLTCAHVWKTPPSSISRGYGCPRCAGVGALSESEADARYAEAGVKRLGDWNGTSTKTACECLGCSHVWAPLPASVFRGQKCPRCCDKAVLTPEDADFRFAERGLKLVEEWKNTATKTATECLECGYVWSPKPYTIFAGCGCPACTKRGFKPDDPAILYYLRVDCAAAGTLYKIGITNNTVYKRFQDPKDRSMITTLRTWPYAIGHAARLAEKEVLVTFNHAKYEGPDVLSSGNTEMFTMDVLGLDTASAPIEQEN